MHTIIVLATGFAILALMIFGGKLLGAPQGMNQAALAFLPVWFIGAGINMYVGVKKAGYSVAEETPMFFLVFSVPAAAALLCWWLIR